MTDTSVTGNVSSFSDKQGTFGPYWIDKNKGVIVYSDNGDNISFARTTDGGDNWSTTNIQNGIEVQIACWYDKETPEDSGGLVHIGWLDAGDSEAKYVTLNIDTGSVGTIRTVDAAATIDFSSSANRIAITKTVSGNIIFAFSTQVEIECYKSADNFATAGTVIADVFETPTEEDWLMLFPASTGDDNDACGIFWDRSANEISIKMYDNSGDSWTETSISAGMTDSAFYKNMDAAVRHSDNHILLAAHSSIDSAGDDLRTWDLTVDSIASPTITVKTNIFTDQVESAQCAMIINQQNDDVYIAYLKGGTWLSSVNVVFHKSTDGMSTWGAEQAYSEAAVDDNRLVHGGRTISNAGGRIQWFWYNDDLTEIFVNLVNDIEIISTGGAAPTFSVDDTITLTEIAVFLGGVAQSFVLNISEGVTLTEDQTFLRSSPGDSFSLSETISIQDNETITFIKSSPVDSFIIEDSVSLTETIDMQASTGQVEFLNISENITLTESIDIPTLIIPKGTSLKIEIDGNEVINDFTASVVKSIGENNRSSSFNAFIDNYTGRNTGSYSIGDSVEVFMDIGSIAPTTKIFSGILEDTMLQGRENREILRLSGRDYSARMMDRTIEPESYNNLPAGSIVKDIIAKYTDDITVNNVTDGTVVDRIVFNHTPVFDAIKELAVFTNFTFYVDVDKDLHFKEKSTSSSGYTFNSTNITKANFKENRDSVYNDIWVYGDRYLDGFKETFTAGSPIGGSVFNLLYKPHNTSITVSGATIQPGGIFQMTSVAGSDVKYLVNYEDQQITFTSGTNQGINIPTSGNSVVITYFRDLPIVKHGDNDDSIDVYGRRTKVIQDTSIRDPLTAETIMLRELDELSDPLKQGTIKVRDVANINVGDTAVVDIPFYNIDEITYDILEAKYDLTKQNLLSNNTLTLKVNKRIPDVTDTLKDILLLQKKMQAQDMQTSDVLTRYKISAGSLSIRTSGIELWEQPIGSSFILGHPINGLLGSYTSHVLGDFRLGSTLNWSGGYF